MKKKESEKIEFAEWCMEQCKPGFEGCKYRGNSIDWLELKRKCLIKSGKKRKKKNVKSI